MTPEAALDWLVTKAWPMWLEHGVDWQRGGFREDIDPANLTSRATFRRLRVVTRQIYVFSQAARMVLPRAEDAVELGLGFLRHTMRQEDGGYIMRCDLDGAVIDPTRDLYDHAFVLLALSHSGRRQAAAEVMAYINSALVHPQCGWRESLPDALQRRQNPHMHLLEAVLSAAEIFGDEVYFQTAAGIVDLFMDRLFQADVAALPEYFDGALAPLREGGCFVWEPGHHHEWVWLLDEHRRIFAAAGRTPRDTSGPSKALMASAERLGVSAAGLIAGEMWSDGRVKQAATRVWPHTERLKALVRSGASASAIEAGLDALWRFCDDVPEGLWRERWADGYVAGESTPASSLYHITCAVLEVQPR